MVKVDLTLTEEGAAGYDAIAARLGVTRVEAVKISLEFLAVAISEASAGRNIGTRAALFPEEETFADWNIGTYKGPDDLVVLMTPGNPLLWRDANRPVQL